MTLRNRLANKPPGYRFTIGRILAIYSGLMVTLLLAALDQTIVSTALPRIVSDLGGLSQYSWVFTAYLLASTVTVPLYGKLGDAYGRRPLFLFSIVLFLLGSALCGAARTGSTTRAPRSLRRGRPRSCSAWSGAAASTRGPRRPWSGRSSPRQCCSRRSPSSSGVCRRRSCPSTCSGGGRSARASPAS